MTKNPNDSSRGTLPALRRAKRERAKRENAKRDLSALPRESRRLLSVAQVQERFKKAGMERSVRTVRDYIYKGALEKRKVGNGHTIRIPAYSVDALIKKLTIPEYEDELELEPEEEGADA